jgi:hypothetical protein
MMASVPPTGTVGRAGVAGTVSASAGGSGSGSRFSKSAFTVEDSMISMSYRSPVSSSAGASVIIWEWLET